MVETVAGREYRPEDAPDRDEIVRVMHIYADNWGKGDPTLFREAFRDDAWLLYTTPDGSLVKKRIWDDFENWASEKVEANCRIISLLQAGDIANVLLGFEAAEWGLGDYWVDLVNLIRVDGVWKITNMTAAHSSRAGGA